MHQEIKNKGEIVIYQTPDGVAELDVCLVCAKFAYTTPHGAIEGKTQTSIVQLYNLDVILWCNYRSHKTNKGIKVDEICRLLNKPKRTVERYLSNLKKLYIINYAGADKTGGYIIYQK